MNYSKSCLHRYIFLRGIYQHFTKSIIKLLRVSYDFDIHCLLHCALIRSFMINTIIHLECFSGEATDSTLAQKQHNLYISNIFFFLQSFNFRLYLLCQQNIYLFT